MTDAKNEAPERIWIEDERPYGGMCHLHSEGTLGQIIYGVEYVRADLLADMTRQRDAATYHIANCAICGRIIDTREIDKGGDTFGCNLQDGRWVCSSDCYDSALAEGAKP